MLDIVANYHCTQFQGKLMNQTQKMAKSLVLGPILAHLAQIQAAKYFFNILASSVTNVMVSCHLVKYQKKLAIQSWENLVTDGRTGRRTRMILWDAVRLTSSVQKHNTVLSENMLQKINKKKGN